jgi:hypothetical protein
MIARCHEKDAILLDHMKQTVLGADPAGPHTG